MATIKHNSSLNAEAAAQALRKAMKGVGTDEKAIIQVLTSCDNAQRQEIALKFKLLYGKDLIDDLKSELDGNLEAAVVALMTPTVDFLAKSLREAMKGAGTDEEELIEVLVPQSNARIAQIKAAYERLFKRDLEKDIMSETSGHFRRILVSLCVGARPETGADHSKAVADAHALHSAGVDQWGTDESEFNRVIMTSSPQQLAATCDEYTKLTQYDLSRTIEKEMSGNLQKAFTAVLESSRNTPLYFADRLYNSMIGGGTDDATLIRCVVTRSEIDMALIKREFLAKHRKTLEKMIADDCGGDFKRILLEVIEEH